jgi:hypothetical protein
VEMWPVQMLADEPCSERREFVNIVYTTPGQLAAG